MADAGASPAILQQPLSDNGLNEYQPGLQPTLTQDDPEDLPGTRRLFDSEGHMLLVPGGDATSLKKHGDIVLIPQPTDSPNDPLQWSLARKIWHTALVCFITALTAATSNDAGSASDGFNEELGIDYSYFNTGAGVLFIGIGYWTLLSSPAVHLYGRRLLYLFAMVLGLAGNLWFGLAQTASDTIWSQLFVGASESVAEALVQLSLMDLWFEHQAGAAIGIYVLATSIGTYMGSLIASYIAQSYLGYRWVGYMGTVFSGGTLILLYFGLEETAFDRARYTTMHGLGLSDRATASALPDSSLAEKKEITTTGQGAATPTAVDVERSGGFASPEKAKTYWQRIAIITPAGNLRGYGFKQYARRLLHTLKVFTFPAVWYAGIQWGAQNAWLTFYLTVEQDNWYGPPWNYTDGEVGNMNIPTVIGSVIGCFLAGWGSDWFTLWITRRKGGIMEAESRLWLMILPTIFFPTGMFLFGIGSGEGWAWPAPYVGLGFIGFGYGCAGDLSMAYLVDAYPEMVLEGMVGVAVINNTIGMIFSFVTSPWMDADGVLYTFVAAGVLAFAALSLSLPMAWWGKTARRWTRENYRQFVADRDGMEL
ncbi:MFS general substrate transporter [Cryphonectria parasitica EP155]|uniref:MFS general substrate transporter n=1 Tax=Cryphonectria parasitica (strain ATCC 38755 / EP155) TaxID=660469 RepID=A0A9P5CN30_CRYP1|nr:MFS general substrate transporter [Cryphonectria parasitica EP155]KAF3763877.1 MFS general substrate transporter [Cryphonectria parasitica EP155]